MIIFSEVPVTPGSLMFAPEAAEAFESSMANEVNRDKLREMAINLGGTILVNCEPPTPARVLEVVMPLVEDNVRADTFARRIFLRGIFEGSLNIYEERKAAELSNV